MTALAMPDGLTPEQGRRSARRAIEADSFPFEYLSLAATAESWRKEINRPTYHMHKWWAQRLSRRDPRLLALRSKIVLACADGAMNIEVAERLQVRAQTVARWRGRFVRHRLEGLSDEPRPGAPRTITDERVEREIVKTLEEAPANQDSHWSTRSMAKATGMSQSAVSRIWQVRPEAARRGDLEAVDRSPVHCEGSRRRRSVPEPA